MNRSKEREEGAVEKGFVEQEDLLGGLITAAGIPFGYYSPTLVTRVASWTAGTTAPAGRFLTEVFERIS